MHFHFFKVCRLSHVVHTSETRREIHLNLIKLNDKVHLSLQLIANDFPFRSICRCTASTHELLDHLDNSSVLLDRNAIVSNH